MDFKSILNKLDSMEAPVVTPAAPELPKAVQLNEDAELRVLAGTSSYLAEAKKAKPDYLDFDKDGNKEEPMKKALKDKEQKTDEAFDADAPVGATKKTASGGTVTKTATGLVHKGKKYGGEEEKSDDDEDAPKAKKAKKESIDPEAFKESFMQMVEAKKKPSAGMTKKEKSAVVKKAKAGEDIGKKGKGFEKVEKAAKKGGAKDPKAVAAAAMWKGEAKKAKKESVETTKRVVAESVEQKLTFKQMVQLVQESGGQQQIDAKDQELFAWAQRVASTKFTESTKQELYAGLIYERMGGVFEMYDVLSEDQE